MLQRWVGATYKKTRVDTFLISLPYAGAAISPMAIL